MVRYAYVGTLPALTPSIAEHTKRWCQGNEVAEVGVSIKIYGGDMSGVRTHTSRNGVVRLIQVPPQKSVPDRSILCMFKHARSTTCVHYRWRAKTPPESSMQMCQVSCPLRDIIEIEIIHNMCRQTRPTVVSRASIPSHTGLISEFSPGLFDQVHLSTHLASLCVDAPREFKKL
jgi:hypothetical protein